MVGNCFRHNFQKPEPSVKTFRDGASARSAVAVVLLNLLFANPSVSEIRNLCDEQQVVAPERVGVLPIFAILVEPGDGDVEPHAAVGVVSPEGGLNRPQPNLVDGFVLGGCHSADCLVGHRSACRRPRTARSNLQDDSLPRISRGKSMGRKVVTPPTQSGHDNLFYHGQFPGRGALPSTAQTINT